jgi:crotonobetainyl-CoA:carnitine CoA-transferase CaiB-like acyl-CoA transferase
LRVGIPISDTIAGLYAAFGILASLRERDRTGRGQEIQTAMVDGLISMFTFAAAAYFSTGQLPPRNGNDHMVVAPYGLFNASDGPIAVAPSTEKNWQQLCTALGLENLMSDPRFDSAGNRREHRGTSMRSWSGHRGRTRQDWITLLNQAGVPCGPVNNLAQAFRTAGTPSGDGHRIRATERADQNARLPHQVVELAGPAAQAVAPGRRTHR